DLSIGRQIEDHRFEAAIPGDVNALAQGRAVKRDDDAAFIEKLHRHRLERASAEYLRQQTKGPGGRTRRAGQRVLAEAGRIGGVAEQTVRIAPARPTPKTQSPIVWRKVRDAGLVAAVVVQLMYHHHVGPGSPGISGALNNKGRLLLRGRSQNARAGVIGRPGWAGV